MRITKPTTTKKKRKIDIREFSTNMFTPIKTNKKIAYDYYYYYLHDAYFLILLGFSTFEKKIELDIKKKQTYS